MNWREIRLNRKEIQLLVGLGIAIVLFVVVALILRDSYKWACEITFGDWLAEQLLHLPRGCY